MKQAAQVSADPLFAPLLALGPLRVWSVVITIFGDLSSQPAVQLSGQDLRALTAPLGIRPDALRVAMHRLRRDGWISSERDGRNSLYSLTKYGFQQCNQARGRIYAAAPARPEEVRLIVLPEDLDPGKEGRIADGSCRRIAPRLLIGTRAAAAKLAEGALLAVPQGLPPEWLRREIAPQGLIGDYAQLDAALRQLGRRLAEAGAPGKPRGRALRILVLHRWRQLLLRHPDLPAGYFGPGWKGESCRAQVMALLAALPSALPDGPNGPA